MNYDVEHTPVMGFTAGAFDLCHPGHVLLIRAARNQCDKLIVGLHTDPTIDRPYTKEKPVQSSYERYVQLSGLLREHDEIIPYDTEGDLLNMLNSLKPQLRFIGSDYYCAEFTGKDIPGIKNIYVNRSHTHSSTELRARLRERDNYE